MEQLPKRLGMDFTSTIEQVKKVNRKLRESVTVHNWNFDKYPQIVCVLLVARYILPKNGV